MTKLPPFQNVRPLVCLDMHQLLLLLLPNWLTIKRDHNKFLMNASNTYIYIYIYMMNASSPAHQKKASLFSLWRSPVAATSSPKAISSSSSPNHSSSCCRGLNNCEILSATVVTQPNQLSPRHKQQVYLYIFVHVIILICMFVLCFIIFYVRTLNCELVGRTRN